MLVSRRECCHCIITVQCAVRSVARGGLVAAGMGCSVTALLVSCRGSQLITLVMCTSGKSRTAPWRGAIFRRWVLQPDSLLLSCCVAVRRHLALAVTSTTSYVTPPVLLQETAKVTGNRSMWKVSFQTKLDAVAMLCSAVTCCLNHEILKHLNICFSTYSGVTDSERICSLLLVIP